MDIHQIWHFLGQILFRVSQQPLLINTLLFSLSNNRKKQKANPKKINKKKNPFSYAWQYLIKPLKS